MGMAPSILRPYGDGSIYMHFALLLEVVIYKAIEQYVCIIMMRVQRYAILFYFQTKNRFIFVYR